MTFTIRSDVFRLVIILISCLAVLWVVRSPQRLATSLYSASVQELSNTGNSESKQEGIMGKAEARKEIEAAVASNKVLVYSKTYCPYCVKAKNALNQFIKPTQYTVVELDQRSDTDVMQDALLDITGGRSVPRVFINGKFLGGGDDTAAAAANGTLQKLLTEAGAL